MTTTGKNANDIEAMIMERIRERPEFAGVLDVTVVPTNPIEEGGWDVSSIIRTGAERPQDLKRFLIGIKYDLLRQFHLSTDL